MRVEVVGVVNLGSERLKGEGGFLPVVLVEVILSVWRKEIVLCDKQVQIGVVVHVHPQRAPAESVKIQAVTG